MTRRFCGCDPVAGVECEGHRMQGPLTGGAVYQKARRYYAERMARIEDDLRRRWIEEDRVEAALAWGIIIVAVAIGFILGGITF